MTTGFVTHENLEVWIEARNLISKIYRASKKFPKEEMYELTNQIRRGAISVPSNIAEGSGRNTTKDKLQFFYISRGSLFELKTQMFVALDFNFITEKGKNDLKSTLNFVKSF
ncbi:four helix bundle protein [Reichenbachiella faecimaris]|nr:four helix bundle protein [Reichenbachiella faecimaris]